MFWVCHWKRPKRFQLGKALPGGNVTADTFFSLILGGIYENCRVTDWGCEPFSMWHLEGELETKDC